MGPLVLEHWESHDKVELFSFEGHETQTVQRSFQLFAELKEIDANPLFPAALRIPAASLRRLLARKKPEAANEFNTLKQLNSPIQGWPFRPATRSSWPRRVVAPMDRIAAGTPKLGGTLSPHRSLRHLRSSLPSRNSRVFRGPRQQDLHRGDVYRVRQPQHGDPKKSRCFIVVSRQELLDSKANRVLCAPVNSEGVGLATEVEVGEAEGLMHPSVVNCDQLTRLEKTLLTDYIGKLSPGKMLRLRSALRVALDVE